MAYGLRLKNPDGSVALDGGQTLSRIAHSQIVASDFTGTIGPIDSFDDTRGALMLSPKAFRYYDFTKYGDGAAYPTEGLYTVNLVCMPSLDWNNTTKLLSVTAAPTYGGLVSDWLITFMMYR